MMTVISDIESVRMSRVQIYSDAWYALSYFEDCANDSVRYDAETRERHKSVLGKVLSNQFYPADVFNEAAILVRELAHDIEDDYNRLRDAGNSPLPLAHMSERLSKTRDEALTALAQCHAISDPKPPTRFERLEAD